MDFDVVVLLLYFSLFTLGWKMMMYCIWLREVRKKGLDVNGYVACFLIKLSFFFIRNVLMKEIVCLTLKCFKITRVDLNNIKISNIKQMSNLNKSKC